MSERDRLLDDAKTTLSERGASYGGIEDNFGVIAEMWGAYLGKAVALDASDVANMMILLKVSRNRRLGVRDNWVDIAGYAACGAECEEALRHGGA